MKLLLPRPEVCTLIIARKAISRCRKRFCGVDCSFYGALSCAAVQQKCQSSISRDGNPQRRENCIICCSNRDALRHSCRFIHLSLQQSGLLGTLHHRRPQRTCVSHSFSRPMTFSSSDEVISSESNDVGELFELHKHKRGAYRIIKALPTQQMKLKTVIERRGVGVTIHLTARFIITARCQLSDLVSRPNGVRNDANPSPPETVFLEFRLANRFSLRKRLVSVGRVDSSPSRHVIVRRSTIVLNILDMSKRQSDSRDVNWPLRPDAKALD